MRKDHSCQKRNVEWDEGNLNFEVVLRCERDKAVAFIVRQTKDDVGATSSKAILKSVSDYSTTVYNLDHTNLLLS